MTGSGSEPYEHVAAIGDVPPGSAQIYEVGSREIALFNVGGTFYALENCCPHQGGPIGEGRLEGALITCPWHAWCFDVRTGRMTLGDFARVARYEVVTDQESVYVSAEQLRDDDE